MIIADVIANLKDILTIFENRKNIFFKHDRKSLNDLLYLLKIIQEITFK